MNKPLPMLASTAVALLLASCASAPTRFYTLQPQAVTSARVPQADYAIRVLPVSVPAQDDRPQLVVRRSDDRVVLLEGDQWSAPLADQLREALSARLTQALGAVDVEGLPQAGKGDIYRVQVNVHRFESVAGRYARLDASWSVHLRGHDDRILACRSALTEPVDGGIGALVRGHQRAIAALSGRIAAVVHSMAAGSATSCP